MENNIDFVSFLVSKKIDGKEFKLSDPTLYQSWMNLFEQVSPDSFTAQKLFLINNIRRKYHLKEIKGVDSTKSKAVSRPKFKKP